MSKESKYDLTPEEFKIPGTEKVIQLVWLPQWKKDKQGNWQEQPPALYMKVPQRLIWFNEEKPDWTIETDIAYLENGMAQAKCTIKDPSGKVMRTGHKTVNPKDPKDWESAETGAIGRALATLGYGTAFAANELEESNDEPVDAPQATEAQRRNIEELIKTKDPALENAVYLTGETWKPKSDAVKKNISTNTKNVLENGLTNDPSPTKRLGSSYSPDPGEYKLEFTKKFLGRKINEIPEPDLDYWIETIEKELEEKGSLYKTKQAFLDNALAHREAWNKNPLKAPVQDFNENLPF